jgi:hypothetical protein
MTTSHLMQSMTGKIMWPALILLAAAAAACGGSTQGVAGTAPSQVSSVAAANDNGGSFSLLKEGKGKGRPTPDLDAPEDPDLDAPEDDADDFGKGHGHGKAAIQYEGFTTSISGGCPDSLVIEFNDTDTTVTKITTDLKTQFQRAKCEALLAKGETPVHVHIAAKKMEDDSLVAIYVRMQGPKFDDPDDAEEEEDTTN